MKALAYAASAGVALAVTAAIAAATTAPGAWQRLPAAPIAPNEALTSVWTGTQMLVFGDHVKRANDGAVLERAPVAASYDPRTHRWRKLAPPGSSGDLVGAASVWTGTEMLVWAQGVHEAYNPSTNSWRTFLSSGLLATHDAHGLVAWTGRELIGWGGGCCGDAFSDGVGFNRRTKRWRALPRGPLAGSQHPVGAWTGRELVILVGNTSPDGKPWPARLARAAAYSPTTNSWRRIAKPPLDLGGATTAWDGRELLAVSPRGATSAYAYEPATNRWSPNASAARRAIRAPSRFSSKTRSSSP